MKALVTGASGFIGSTLIEELGRCGFEVRALLRTTSSLKNLEGLKYEKTLGSMSDFESLVKAVEGVDYVFHLAGAIASPDRNGFFRENTEGTLNLARAVEQAAPNLSRFIFVSSLAAGGPSQSFSPRIETDTDAPVSAYGESKLEAEQALMAFKDKFPIVIARPPMVYGPKDPATFVFVKTVSRNLMPLVAGTSSPDGNKYFSTIHVKDLCRGLLQIALVESKKIVSGDRFYLCGDEFTTYEQILRTVADHLQRQPLRFKIPTRLLTVAAQVATVIQKATGKNFPFNMDKMNEIRPDFWICSNQKAKDKVDFRPEYDFRQGMQNAIEWYKKNHWISGE